MRLILTPANSISVKMQAMRLHLLVLVLGAAVLAHAETLLVLNKEGSLAIVDAASRKVLGSVRTGEQPHEAEASEDGTLAYVSNYGGPGAGGNTLSVIDIAARKEIHRVDLGPLHRPHGLWPVGGKVYFTAESNKVIGRYDPKTNQVDWVLGTGQNGTHMVLVTPDEKLMFTANIASNSITMIEAAGVQNWNETVIPVGKGPEGFDLSPDGKQIWAANSQDGSVSVIDVATKKVVQTFGVQTKRSNRLKFTPDGRLVLISDLAAGDLLVLQRDTKKELKRLRLGASPAGILVEPSSARAYVAVTGDNNVAVIDLKTLELEARIQTGNGPDGMAWVK
jgi:YVTN family beta-propeller protein